MIIQVAAKVVHVLPFSHEPIVLPAFPAADYSSFRIWMSFFSCVCLLFPIDKGAEHCSLRESKTTLLRRWTVQLIKQPLAHTIAR